MSRAVKIVAAAAFGGFLMAVAVVAARHDAPREPGIVVVPDETAPEAQADMARCRAITMPDSGCEAAWEARRRRFFGRKDQP